MLYTIPRCARYPACASRIAHARLIFAVVDALFGWMT